MTEADYTIVLDLKTASPAQNVARGHRAGNVIGRAMRSVGFGATLANSLKTSGVVGGAGRFAVGTGVVGALAAISTLGGLAFMRLSGGQSFSNIGSRLNEAILGELDDEARAKHAVRQALEGNKDLMRALGQNPGLLGQIAKVGDKMYEQQRLRERGRSLIEQDPTFQTDTLLDILIKRARDFIVGECVADPNWRAITRQRDADLRGHR